MLDLAHPAARRAWARRILRPLDESAWDDLARELFAWQFARVPAYRRLCLAHNVTPKKLNDWREIPAVPQQLFKLETLFAHGSLKPAAIYETSGTTTGQPGRQNLLRPDIYRAAATAGARRVGLLAGKPQLHFLTPSPAESPRSSLSSMFGFWGKTVPSRFWIRREKFDFVGLRGTLSRQIKARQVVGIAGTAFSFVHLLDAWKNLPPLTLRPGSWLLETGGFKGRSREVPKPELYAQLSRLFTLPDKNIWNEYGMSELSSQAYARGTSGLHSTPPWTRVLIWNPATNREVKLGQRGLVRWFDLANTDSVFALQTLDLAERTHDGFRLLGRMSRTEPRGCSLGIEDMMAGEKKP